MGAGGWRLEVEGWRLEVRGRMLLVVVGCKLFETFIFNLDKIEALLSFIRSFFMLNNMRWLLGCWMYKITTN